MLWANERQHVERCTRRKQLTSASACIHTYARTSAGVFPWFADPQSPAQGPPWLHQSWQRHRHPTQTPSHGSSEVSHRTHLIVLHSNHVTCQWHGWASALSSWTSIGHNSHVYIQFQVSCPIAEDKKQTDQSNLPYSWQWDSVYIACIWLVSIYFSFFHNGTSNLKLTVCRTVKPQLVIIGVCTDLGIAQGVYFTTPPTACLCVCPESCVEGWFSSSPPHICMYTHTDNTTTVEPLYRGHHWDPVGCPVSRGVPNSGVDLYTAMCGWDCRQCPH